MEANEIFLLYGSGVGAGILLTAVPWCLGRLVQVVHTILRSA